MQGEGVDKMKLKETESILLLHDIVRPGNFLPLGDDAIISTHVPGLGNPASSVEDEIATSLRRLAPEGSTGEVRQSSMDISEGVRSIIKDELTGWIQKNVPVLIREVMAEEGLELKKTSGVKSSSRAGKPSGASPKPKAKSKAAKKQARKSAAGNAANSVPKKAPKKTSKKAPKQATRKTRTTAPKKAGKRGRPPKATTLSS